MISIRKARRDDVAALVAIDPLSLADPSRRRQIAHWAAAGHCHVAVRADRVVGYVALTSDFFHQPFIEMLVVGADARRYGVGLALVEHCIAEISPGAKLWSSTNRSNIAMQALLGKAGFVRSGVVDNLDEGDPELIYLRPPVETDPRIVDFRGLPPTR